MSIIVIVYALTKELHKINAVNWPVPKWFRQDFEKFSSQGLRNMNYKYCICAYNHTVKGRYVQH